MNGTQGVTMFEVRPEESDHLFQDSLGIQTSLVQTFFPRAMLDERVSQSNIQHWKIMV